MVIGVQGKLGGKSPLGCRVSRLSQRIRTRSQRSNFPFLGYLNTLRWLEGTCTATDGWLIRFAI